MTLTALLGVGQRRVPVDAQISISQSATARLTVVVVDLLRRMTQTTAVLVLTLVGAVAMVALVVSAFHGSLTTAPSGMKKIDERPSSLSEIGYSSLTLMKSLGGSTVY